jgi:energy-coupling factor transport system substrate-specific component
VAALLYGFLVNFWFWPFVGANTTYSFIPGAGVLTNLHRFLLFDLTTSMGFDLTRAVTCAILVLVLGRPVLAALRRTSRRAVFQPAPQFVEGNSPSQGSTEAL